MGGRKTRLRVVFNEVVLAGLWMLVGDLHVDDAVGTRYADSTLRLRGGNSAKSVRHVVDMLLHLYQILVDAGMGIF